MQQGRLGDGVEIEVHDLSDEDSETSGSKKKWKSITWVRGKEYTYQFLHVGKRKNVMHLAAEKLLEELLPGAYVSRWLCCVSTPHHRHHPRH